MIAVVSLRLLYLLFQQVLGLVRPSSTRDVELIVLRHEVAVLRRTNPRARLDGRTGPCSPAVIGAHRRTGMIVVVSFRLLYLIFARLSAG